MRKLSIAIASFVLAVGLTGCAGTPPSRVLAFSVTNTKASVIPPPGMIYMRSRAPLKAGAPRQPFGSRQGTATAHSIGLPPLPFPGLETGIVLFGWGDASLETAQSNGGISESTHSDYESVVVLMLYRRMKVIAYGD